MKRFLKSITALIVLVVCSTVARAVWDSTTGNMPNFYQLCWGLNSTACVYGSSISNYVRIQTGGVDAITVNSSQAVGIPGALTVTGVLTASGGVVGTVTGNVTGSITASGGNVVVSSISASAFPLDIRGSYSSAELATLSGNLGKVVLNTSVPAICVGTGTTASAGAWVFTSTSILSGLVPCHS